MQLALINKQERTECTLKLRISFKCDGQFFKRPAICETDSRAFLTGSEGEEVERKARQGGREAIESRGGRADGVAAAGAAEGGGQELSQLPDLLHRAPRARASRAWRSCASGCRRLPKP